MRGCSSGCGCGPPAGVTAPLSQVALIRRECLPAELLSDNLRPLVAVTGRLEGRDLGSVTADVEARLAELKPPRAWSCAWVGSATASTSPSASWCSCSPWPPSASSSS